MTETLFLSMPSNQSGHWQFVAFKHLKCGYCDSETKFYILIHCNLNIHTWLVATVLVLPRREYIQPSEKLESLSCNFPLHILSTEKD